MGFFLYLPPPPPPKKFDSLQELFVDLNDPCDSIPLFGSSYPLLSGSDKLSLSRISTSLDFSVDDETILFWVLLGIGP